MKMKPFVEQKMHFVFVALLDDKFNQSEEKGNKMKNMLRKVKKELEQVKKEVVAGIINDFLS